MTNWLGMSFEMRFRVIDGLTVRFAEGGADGRHALLLSPWPESILAFRPVWGRLAEHAHLVALDLPGFGHSQRDNALLSPTEMAGFIVRAVRAFGLDHPHVVGPDIGTPSALFAAALYPGQLRSLVVGGGGAVFPLQLGGALKEWAGTSDLERFRRESPSIVAAMLAENRRLPLPDDVRDDYLRCYRGDRFVESMRYVRAYPQQLPLLRDLLPHISTPVQIIAGAQDDLVPSVNAHFLHQRLPHSRLDLIDAGHFTWEDAADEYAMLVTDWWRGRYARTGASAPL